MSLIPHLINGELVTEDGRTADVFNPSTGQAIHKLPLASRETIQKKPSTRPKLRSRPGVTLRRPSVLR